MKVMIIAAAFTLSTVSFAADTFPKCAAEIAKFKCTGDDKTKYECLEKHDADLSKACDEDHGAYEKAHAVKK